VSTRLAPPILSQIISFIYINISIMKHIALLTTLLLSASLQAVEKPYDYVFFENSLMKGDYFYSQAKYTSPSWIKNARHHLPVAGSVAFTPGNSLELTYVSAPGGDWYSEIQY
jgi:fibronectin type III domain-containing protein